MPPDAPRPSTSATTGSARRCSRCGAATATPRRCCSASTQKLGSDHRRGDVPRRARAVARRQGRRRDRLVPQGRRRVSAHRVGRRRRSSSPAGSSSTAATTRRRSRRSRSRSRAIRRRSGSTTRCGSSACRTTSSASGTPARTQARRAREARRLRSRAARACTGSRASTSGSATRRRRDGRLSRDRQRRTRSPGTRCSRARGSRSAVIEARPFGDDDADAEGAPSSPATVDPKLASDELIVRADELIAAGLGVDAGVELARDERGFLKRHDRARGVRDAARPLPQGRQLQPAVDARGQLLGQRARRPARRRRDAAGGRTRIRARIASWSRSTRTLGKNPDGLPLLDHAQGERLRSARPVVRRRAGPAADDPADDDARREGARDPVRPGQALRARVQHPDRQLVHRAPARRSSRARSRSAPARSTAARAR